jgi:hypothetical protein
VVRGAALRPSIKSLRVASSDIPHALVIFVREGDIEVEEGGLWDLTMDLGEY